MVGCGRTLVLWFVTGCARESRMCRCWAEMAALLLAWLPWGWAVLWPAVRIRHGYRLIGAVRMLVEGSTGSVAFLSRLLSPPFLVLHSPAPRNLPLSLSPLSVILLVPSKRNQ